MIRYIVLGILTCLFFGCEKSDLEPRSQTFSVDVTTSKQNSVVKEIVVRINGSYIFLKSKNDTEIFIQQLESTVLDLKSVVDEFKTEELNH